MTTPGRPSDENDYDRAACGLLTTSADGTMLRVNDTFCRWVGRDREGLVGRRFQDLLAVGSKLFHQTHWMPLLLMQGSVSEVQLELVDGDEQTLPVLVNAVRRESAKGPSASTIDIAVFVARDRRQYERELLLARRRAEELLEREQAVQSALRRLEQEARERASFAEQLIGIVSHDLRSPIYAVILGAQFLGRNLREGKTAEVATTIAAAAERANKMVADLLDFTQARLRGGLHVDRRSFDPHRVFGACLEELRLAWPGRTIRHREIGSGSAVGDPDRLAQVLMNLVGNAMTYGAADAPVRVTSSVDAATLTLAVSNDGEPIPRDVLPGIFEPLLRGDDRGSGARSVGLGLYIVREIARAHRGDVMVRSNREEGTTFIVTIPQDLTP